MAYQTCGKCQYTVPHEQDANTLLCVGDPPQLLQRYSRGPVRFGDMVGADAAYPMVTVNTPACRVFKAAPAPRKEPA